MKEKSGIKTDKKGRFLPGTAPGPGRPKGSISMKEFARKFLMSMNDEQKIEFLNSLNPDVVWRMAEGNPANDMKIDGEVKHTLYLPSELLEKNDIPQISEGDSEKQEQIQSS